MFNDFEDGNVANIPEALRSMNRHKTHLAVDREWPIGSKDARCNTKEFMYNVWNGTVYMIAREELLRFEAGLTPDEWQKASFFNISFLARKLNDLLVQRGMPPLGYPPGTQPDEEHFTRILRYTDRFNVLGGFKRRVTNAIPPVCFAGRV